MDYKPAPPHKSAMIQVQDIVKTFQVGGNPVTVLNRVTFSIEAGEFVAIVGPSGNGKSTLLNMITGIDHPNQGKIIVAGKAIHQLSENQLAAWRADHVGIVFQFFQLLPSLSLLQNIILPMEFAGKIPARERKERAHYLLERVGLADQAAKLPGTVSGGQQQRAAIARALANDPPLIVADEPTGNLDAATAEDVFCLFLSLVREGKTLVMVTHNQELAERLPRTLHILNGRVDYDITRIEQRGGQYKDFDALQRDFNCTSGPAGT